MDTCYPFQTHPCDWGIAFLWSLTGRIVRFDVLLLALMLAYVLVIGCRGSYLYYLARYQSRRFLRQGMNLLRTSSFEEVIAISGAVHQKSYRRNDGSRAERFPLGIVESAP